MGKFACSVCGKQYTWKDSIAGKRARCACGASLLVPKTDPAAETSASSDNGDLYDLAEPVEQPRTVVPVPAVAPAVVAGAGGSSVRPLTYRSAGRGNEPEDREAERFSFDRITHPPRDLYVPVALLVAGFFATFAWAIVEVDAGAFGVIVVSIITSVFTVIKTAILIALALVIAPRFGVSFGELRTAILKFAALVIFTDAALLWFDFAVEAAGGVRPGRISIRIMAISLFFSAALIGSLMLYLFDMERDDTALVAFPFALASKIIGFVLNLIAVVILSALLSP